MTAAAARAAAFIGAHLPVEPVPGIPALRLHKAGPASGVGRWLGYAAAAPPYWAYWWAGGLALALHLLAHPQLVAGRRVLDLGAGGGLVGIAAARAGAAVVVASEIDANARVAIGLNAALNGVSVEAVEGDLTGGAATDAELVLAGDVFYTPDVAAATARFLDCCVEAGASVLVGDPWRAPLPLDRLRLLARYDVEEAGTPKAAGVFAYRR